MSLKMTLHRQAICFLLIPRSASYEDFTTCLCLKICLHCQPTMETASPTATTRFQPTTTSTPALGGAESLSFTEDPGFEASMNFGHSMEDERAQKC